MQIIKMLITDSTNAFQATCLELGAGTGPQERPAYERTGKQPAHQLFPTSYSINAFVCMCRAAIGH